MKKMGDYECKLVSDNLGLVYAVINGEFGSNFANDEDVMSIGREAMCKAALKWKPSLGKFSAFASRVIKNDVKTWWKYEHRQKRHPDMPIYSLDATMSNDDRESTFTLNDVLYNGVNMEDEVINAMIIDENVIELIKHVAPITTRNVLEGVSKVDIGKSMGVTSQRISQLVAEERRKVREMFDDPESLNPYDICKGAMVYAS